MRIAWTGIGLPGPFRLVPGGPGRGAGCGPFILAAVALGFADWYPWLIAVAAGILAAGWVLSRRR
jgi:hypothetical protein